MRWWTTGEIRTLCERYPVEGYVPLVKALKRGKYSIQGKVAGLGLKRKPPSADTNDIIGRLIDQRRKKRLSQEFVAEYMGVNKVTVYRWENNVSAMSLKQVNELAGLYDMQLALTKKKNIWEPTEYDPK